MLFDSGRVPEETVFRANTASPPIAIKNDRKTDRVPNKNGTVTYTFYSTSVFLVTLMPNFKHTMFFHCSKCATTPMHWI